MPTYQPNIPTGTVDLDVDYQNLQGNFQQLNVVFGTDHTPFSNATPQAGYHTDIHLIPTSTVVGNPPNNYPPTVPAAIAGYSQFFAVEENDGINTDTALYHLSGGNRLTALTRNFQPTAANPGVTFLPGGMILQWATALYASGAAVVFPQAMTNCFGVMATFTDAATQGFISTTSQTGTGFTFITRNSSNTGALPARSISWMAIGN